MNFEPQQCDTIGSGEYSTSDEQEAPKPWSTATQRGGNHGQQPVARQLMPAVSGGQTLARLVMDRRRSHNIVLKSLGCFEPISSKRP